MERPRAAGRGLCLCAKPRQEEIANQLTDFSGILQSTLCRLQGIEKDSRISGKMNSLLSGSCKA